MIAYSLAMTACALLPLAGQSSLNANPLNAEPVQAMALGNDLQSTRSISSAPNGPPTGMVKVEGGEVVVGTPPENVEDLGQKDITNMTMIAAETPRRVESVETFFIDRTEVTNLQWQVFLEATGRTPSEALVNYGWPEGKIPEGQEHYPITNVNYPEIRAYLEWAGKRLPTEVEWIRAARGDSDQDYPWGTRFKSSLAQTGLSVPQQPVPVDSHAGGVSSFGVLGMTGNVFEWTQSPFVHYEGYRPIDYKRGRKQSKLSPAFNSSMRVIKGGAFNSTREVSRIDFRIGMNPSDSDANIGFRAARSSKPGLESLRHADRFLQSPMLAKHTSVDHINEEDTFGVERIDFDPKRQVQTEYHHLAFGVLARGRHPAYSKLKRSAVDEPFPVGLLSTSEELSKPRLPAGEYTVAFKGKGESDNYKAWKKEMKKVKADKKGSGADLPERSDGAMSPWPGPPGMGIHDFMEDFWDFPQDQEVMLFYNANNAIVGWIPIKDAGDDAVGPLEVSEPEDGRTWEISFSIDNTKRKGPRFTMAVEVAGDGLKK